MKAQHVRISAKDWFISLATLMGAMLLVFSGARAQAQTFTVLHAFGPNGGPYQPYNGLAMTPGGILYGTSLRGGSSGNGTAFELKRTGSGWLLNVLHNFQGGTDGAMPVAAVMIAPDGVLYGTTSQGGDPNCGTNGGCGTVYSLQPPAHAPLSALTPWTEKVLYAFQGGSDGRTPGYGAPAFDSNGAIYGTTEFGGDVQDCGSNGCGTVWELSPTSSGGWTEQVRHRFNGSSSEGAVPVGGIVLLPGYDDILGFTTVDYQVFFGLEPFTFEYYYIDQLSNTYGCDVNTTLLFDPNTFTFYGVAQGCGSAGEYGGGMVFSWFYGFTVLHDFGTTRGNYPAPEGPLIQDTAGNLYGVSFNGGAHQSGSVYKVSPARDYTELYSFTGGDDGSGPVGNLVMDAAGNLYGVTASGGPSLGGVVFEITP